MCQLLAFSSGLHLEKGDFYAGGFWGRHCDSLRAAFRGGGQAKYTIIRANFMAVMGCAALIKERIHTLVKMRRL
jgi:hypothetical protein